LAFLLPEKRKEKKRKEKKEGLLIGISFNRGLL
jgi:hypothetical protein